MKNKHELISLETLKIIYPNHSKVLMCWKFKEAFQAPNGFRFCPGCGLDVAELCRKKSFLELLGGQNREETKKKLLVGLMKTPYKNKQRGRRKR